MTFTLTAAHLDTFLGPTATGDWAPFRAACAPNCRWWITSDGERRVDKPAGWYTFDEWVELVQKPLKARLVDAHTMAVVSAHVDDAGKTAYVEAKGGSTQANGRPYHNNYFWVMKFDSETGKIVELREFMDSELVSEVIRTNEAA
ncbi:hypothetical protein JCM10450v2_001559 [Rhodotorula kratochvilovae]